MNASPLNESKLKGNTIFTFLLGFVVLILAVFLLFLFIHSFNHDTTSTAAAPERQQLPPVNALELPPPAPLPSTPHFSMTHLNPKPQESDKPKVAQTKPKAVTPSQAPSKAKTATKRHIPSVWEIMEKYTQVVDLDVKYYSIATECDRFGHTNQAIIYYKKYLFIAPSGPHAQEVKGRLEQL